MADASMKIQCGRCSGTGIDSNMRDENGIPIPASCQACGGDGLMESGKIDISIIMDELDYIHGKVTAIWNKVK